MTTKNKAVWAGTRTASRNAFDDRNHTGFNSLAGWFNQAKSGRLHRQQKRGWQKGGRR